jgi:hypothetical protein
VTHSDSLVALTEGGAALDAGAWQQAQHAFERALAIEDTPEAREGLGLAAWWLDLADVVFDSRERAYRAYRSRGDQASAARLAVWIGWDSAGFRGEEGVANGWLERARRLLKISPIPPSTRSSPSAPRSSPCSTRAILKPPRRWPPKRFASARRSARSITRWSAARCAASRA